MKIRDWCLKQANRIMILLLIIVVYRGHMEYSYRFYQRRIKMELREIIGSKTFEDLATDLVRDIMEGLREERNNERNQV